MLQASIEDQAASTVVAHRVRTDKYRLLHRTLSERRDPTPCTQHADPWHGSLAEQITEFRRAVGLDFRLPLFETELNARLTSREAFPKLA